MADVERAATAFDLGVRAARAGALRNALRWFEVAYLLSPDDAVLFNLARLHESLGHASVAAMLYARWQSHTSGNAVSASSAGTTASRRLVVSPRH